MRFHFMHWVTAAVAVAAVTAGLAGVRRATAGEPSKEQTEAMQGTWTIESFTLNGNVLAADQIKNWRRIVENDHVTWKNGDQSMVETDMKYDPSQSPMTLDTTITSGDAKGQILLAIYELTDDTLKVCFSMPGKPRPTEFVSNPGTEQSLFTAKRVQP